MATPWTDTVTGITHNVGCAEAIYKTGEDGKLWCRKCGAVQDLSMTATLERLTNPPAPQERVSVKSDDGKLKWHLLPIKAVEEVIRGYMFGANKYGEGNWEAPGFDYSRLYDAAQRHLTSWWNGEDEASDTKVHHLAHATCCLLMLLTYKYTGAGRDDRAIETRIQSKNPQ